MAVIALLGVVLRLGIALHYGNAGVEPDESDYVNSAVGLLEEGSFDRTVYYHIPPLFPAGLAGLFLFVPPGYLAARAAQAFLFLAMAAVLFALGRELTGRRLGGVLLALIGALYPYFIYYSSVVLTETLAALLIPLTLLLAVRSVRMPGILPPILFGASLALGGLTRASIGYFVLAVPLIYAIGMGVVNLRWLKATALALLGFFTFYGPWMAVNARYFGRWMFSPTIGGGIVLYQTGLSLTMPDPMERMAFLRKEIIPKYYYPEGATHRDRLAGDLHLKQEGMRLIRQDLDRYPKILWKNFKRFWQFYPNTPDGAPVSKTMRFVLAGLGSYGALFPFFIGGAILGLRRFRVLAALYGFIAFFTLFHIIIFTMMRYRVPMDPIILGFAVMGILAVADRMIPARTAQIEAWLSPTP